MGTNIGSLRNRKLTATMVKLYNYNQTGNFQNLFKLQQSMSITLSNFFEIIYIYTCSSQFLKLKKKFFAIFLVIYILKLNFKGK